MEWQTGSMPLENDADNHLANAVEDLNQEVRVLREAIDELRETLQWACQNKGAEQTYSVLKSFPLDLSADDWHERVRLSTGPSAMVDEQPHESTPENTVSPPAPNGETLFCPDRLE